MEEHFVDRASWRAWLEANRESTRELWMVCYKKHTGRENISYDDAVEEALCVGWIDSLIKRLDEDRYARKFTPRTNTGKWSELNLRRVAKLKAEGRMTPTGLARLDPDVKPVASAAKRPLEVPPFFQEALEASPAARAFFAQLAPSYRRQFVGWVSEAKREATRQKRLSEAISLMAQGKKLSMK
jgi:uncharacterized protein YdeI (YjbR/CyaY-like superfamily)